MDTPQLKFNLQPERKIFSVSDLTARIRDLFAKNFTDTTVQGEISNCRPATSGHIYFTLKDEKAQIRCVLFKSQQRGMRLRPEDGLKVTVRGTISVYEARGEYQIYVESIEPLGRGALQQAFEELKNRLQEEGLFAAQRKKALPLLPSRVGLITSPTGAAVRDVARIMTRRFPNVHLTLYPVRVQGVGCESQMIEAIRYFDRTRSADVILIVRGGGSLEDLCGFNDEELARAIVACSIPIITGVGHETDFTIADFVADVRASTPSAAAELVVQTRREFDKHVSNLQADLTSLMRYRLTDLHGKVHQLLGRNGFRRPLDILRQQRQRADDLTSRLAQGLRSRLEQSRRRFAGAHLRISSFDFRMKIAALRLQLQEQGSDLDLRAERIIRWKREHCERLSLQLHERSPMRVLERGYAIATDAAGNVLRDTNQISIGDSVRIQLHHGRFTSEIIEKESKNSDS